MEWERLNRGEAAMIAANPALPPSPAHPVVTATTAAARGGLLWLAFCLFEALRPGGDRRLAGRGATAIVAAIAAGHLIKRLAPRRARPSRPGAATRRGLPEQPDSSSFPSTHAASAAAFTTVVIAARANHLALLTTPLAVLATYGRVRTRVHYPSDLLAGITVGVAIGGTVAFASRDRGPSGGPLPLPWRRAGKRSAA